MRNVWRGLNVKNTLLNSFNAITLNHSLISNTMSSQQHKLELERVIQNYLDDPLTTSVEIYSDLQEILARIVNNQQNNITKSQALQSLILHQRPTSLDNNVTQEQVTQSFNIPPRY